MASLTFRFGYDTAFFRAACAHGLVGMVSKGVERPIAQGEMAIGQPVIDMQVITCI
jgi:hypothetical protein